MTRAGYIFAMLTLTWVASQSVVYFPGLWNWSSFIDLGCVLAVIVAVIAALISRKWSALATFSCCWWDWLWRLMVYSPTS
jgi:hypothetical protein